MPCKRTSSKSVGFDRFREPLAIGLMTAIRLIAAAQSPCSY